MHFVYALRLWDAKFKVYLVAEISRQYSIQAAAWVLMADSAKFILKIRSKEQQSTKIWKIFSLARKAVCI